MTTPSLPDPRNIETPLGESAKTEPPSLTASAGDADLIGAARSGDADAYGVLYERHAAAARRLASQIVKTPADADDVVAETFARVLYALRNGNGPAEAFRPYLLTAVRRVAIDLVSGQRRQIPTDGADLPDPGEPFYDPAVADLDRSLITRAFWSLPERWRAVLWHTEIEESKPAEVAALLGLSANGVSVLRRRAREGLSQTYLQLHLADRANTSCTQTAGKLARYVRGGLSRRQAREVETHLADCASCTAACADLTAINDTLRGVLAPVVLGAAAAGYLASASQTQGAAAAAASLAHGQAGLRALRLAVRRAADAITRHPIASVGTAAAVTAIAVPGLYFLHPPSGHQPASGFGQAQRHGGAGAAGRAPGSRKGIGGSPSTTPIPSATTSRGVSPKPTNSRAGKASPSSPSSTSPPASPGPTPTPTPKPTPSPTVSGTAKLSVSVQVNGVLNLGVTALVTVNVSDPGTAATGPVTVNITLPSGITLLGLVGSSSWSCSPTSAGQTCTHGAIGAGAASSLSFNILVVNLTGCGNSVVAKAVSGSLSATGASAAKVQCA
ncbi:MAG TPA: sigma-70 family RNA polymerase sigma factor [Streptosporangiaceae bacterium]|nr:sigma-70 family RNA polymerase sigma factor [Streptosporangiaceae bacterium]